MVVGSICASLLVGTLGAHAASLPPDPNNAALLYYQALLLCPDPDDIPREVGAVFHAESGGDAGQYRDYVKDYQDVIQLVEAASRISHCNWAIPYPQGLKVRAKLMPLTRSLALVIGANVRVLASDGDYTEAFAHSLMLRRVAKHIADDPGTFDPVPVTVERTALFCVRLVLDVMPPDEKALTTLREQLDAEPPVSELVPARIKQDFEWLIHTIKGTGAATLSNLRQNLAENANDEAQKKEVMALKDDELLSLIRESYAAFLDSAFDVMGSQMSYEQKYIRLENMAEQYQERAKTNPEIILAVQIRAESVPGLYSIGITHVALFNAVTAAIEIYLLKATNGQLPEALPEGLPKDPFSGNDFEYKATKEGFVLRCRAKDIAWGGVRQYEFKVRE
jgi:hypothetical protein